MINKKRFNENDTMWPWISLWLKIKKILYKEKTKYQDLLVFESESFWNVLVLDWVIQLTDRDEANYQEMLAHIPLFIHKLPKRVLIIWGWDWGVLREVLKHNSVEDIILCEIDKKVIEVSKTFFPDISSWFNNNKAKIIIQDWKSYLLNNKEKFDVIIVDSSDPVWPANTLFTEQFYKYIKDNLYNGWVIVIQWESLFLHKDLAVRLKKYMKSLFKYTNYSQVHVPTYPWWNIWLLACSNSNKVTSPSRKIPKDIEDWFKYYSKEVHESSFILPPSYKI